MNKSLFNTILGIIILIIVLVFNYLLISNICFVESTQIKADTITVFSNYDYSKEIKQQKTIDSLNTVVHSLKLQDGTYVEKYKNINKKYEKDIINIDTLSINQQIELFYNSPIFSE